MERRNVAAGLVLASLAPALSAQSYELQYEFGATDLDRPRDVAIFRNCTEDLDYVFVADSDLHQVLRYPGNGVSDAADLVTGSVFTGGPWGVAVDDSIASPNYGQVYATEFDGTTARIFIYESLDFGLPTAVLLGSPNLLVTPRGIAVDAQGNVYVADAPPQAAPGRVFKISAADAAYSGPVSTILTPELVFDSGTGQALDVSVDLGGRVHTTQSNGELVVFGPGGGIFSSGALVPGMRGIDAKDDGGDTWLSFAALASRRSWNYFTASSATDFSVGATELVDAEGLEFQKYLRTESFPYVCEERVFVTDALSGRVRVYGSDCESTPCPPGAVAMWRFEDTTDSVGDNDGVMSGTTLPYFSNGRVCKAMSFPGGGAGELAVAHDASLSFGTGDFSAEGWVLSTDTTASRTLFAKLDAASGYRLQLEAGYLGVLLRVASTDGSLSVATDANFVADGTWHHFAVTVDRDAMTTLYVDGVSTTSAASLAGDLDNTVPLSIGSSASGDGFEGALDELTLYDRVLLPVEITRIVDAACAGKRGTATSLPIVPGMLVATFASGHSGATDGSTAEGFTVGLIDVTDPDPALLDTNWYAPMFHNELDPSSPAHIWNGENLGQVFGVALDDEAPPNIYVAATSSYGFMGAPYSFGPGGPGAVYRLDGVTGDISPFLVTGPGGVGTNEIPNTGPALGNICFDRVNDQFFVTNFEDGKIYRVDTAGIILSVFDPFAPDDGTPGFAPLGERPWGVQMYSNERLLFTVWLRDIVRNDTPWPASWPPQGTNPANNAVFSVAIDETGEFVGEAQLEVVLPFFTFGEYSMPAADLVLSPVCRHVRIAERSMIADDFPNTRISRVLEYWAGTVALWPGSDTYDVGYVSFNANAAGGVALDADLNTWATGYGLKNAVGEGIFGLQRIDLGGNGDDATPTENSYLIDLNGIVSTSDKVEIGDCEVWLLEPGPCNVPGAPYAYGIACPCGNDDPVGGCGNSTGGGATLEGSGSTSVASDDLVLEAAGLVPGMAALLVASSMPELTFTAPFGDGRWALGSRDLLLGLDLATGNRTGTGKIDWTTVLRVGVRTVDQLGTTSFGPGLASTLRAVPGSTIGFQVLYRDPGGPCGTGFNLSHGYAVTFAP